MISSHTLFPLTFYPWYANLMALCICLIYMKLLCFSHDSCRVCGICAPEAANVSDNDIFGRNVLFFYVFFCLCMLWNWAPKGKCLYLMMMTMIVLVVQMFSINIQHKLRTDLNAWLQKKQIFLIVFYWKVENFFFAKSTSEMCACFWIV